MATLMLGRSFGLAAAFAIPMVLARVFEPAEFGTYRQLFLIYATAFGIAQLGMAEGLYYFVPGRPAPGPFIANAASALGLAGLSCWLLLAWGAPLLAQQMQNAALAPLVPLAGAFLACMLLSAVLEISLIAGERYAAAAGTYLISDLLRAAALVLAATSFGSVRALMLAAVAFALMRVLATAVVLARLHGAALRPNAAAYLAQIRYAAPFACAVAVETLQVHIHQYAVAHFFAASAFAIYSVACLQIPMVDLAAGSANNVMMVQLARAVRSDAPAEARSAWLDAVTKLASIFIPLAFFLMFAAKDLIVVLFTERYAAAAPIFRIACAATLLAVFPVDSALRSYARTGFLLRMHVARLVLTLLALPVGIYVAGMPGAMLATIAAATAAKILGARRVAKDLNVAPTCLVAWRPYARIVGATSVGVGSAWLVCAALPSEPHLRLVTSALVFGAAYGFALLARRPPHAVGLAVPITPKF